MPGSILDQIKERRQALATDQYADLPIPTWGGDHPPAWFRVKPVPLTTIMRFRDRAQKAKGAAVAAAALAANVSIIAAAATHVVIGEGDQQAVFDLDSPDLLEALGIPDATGRGQVIQAIVGNDVTGADGYIISLADAVGRHSGHSAEITEETLQGE